VVNNEIAWYSLWPRLAARCREAGVPFHVDGVQAFGKIPVSLHDVACTLLTISGHKVGAPKGIGALVVRDRHVIEAIIHGRRPAVRDPAGHGERAGHRGLGAPQRSQRASRRRSRPPWRRCATSSSAGCSPSSRTP